MLKRKNKVYRRVVVALTVALLAGQSHVFVLAEENTYVPQTEIFSEQLDANIPDSGSESDSGSAENNGDQQGDGDEQEVVKTQEGVKPAEEAHLEESLDENLDENAGIVTLAEEDEDTLVTGEDFTDGGIVYKLTADYKLEVVSHQESESGVVIIPETVRGYPVTTIKSGAFDYCNSLKRITIPASVTSIEHAAFMECSNLESVTMLGGVTSIKYSAFMKCSSLTSVAIPESVTRIEEHAFSGCSSLESIAIPGSVTSIEWSAFSECSSLKSITIPAGVTSIEMNTFAECTSLTSVTMLGSVTSIGDDAFSSCSSLIEVTIPGSVEKIGERAFGGCTQLEKQVCISVPTGGQPRFPEVGTNAFYNLPSSDHRKDIIFVDENGHELTEEALKEANVKAAFKEAAANDGDSDDSTWHGWPYQKSSEVEEWHIMAEAAEGGAIDPKGDIVVVAGTEKKFTITPDEGNKIKAVTVDDKDVTAQLQSALTRAPGEAKSYTFINVTGNHTIHALFESNSGDNLGGGGDNPDSGGDNHGSNGGDNSDGGNNGGGSTNPDDGSNARDGQTTAGTQAVGGAAVEKSGSTGDGLTSDASGQSVGAAGTKANGREPKTGDAAHLEVHATIAMTAGLTYLLLYVMEEGRGMNKREKDAFVAAFIRWGKKGGAFRKCCAFFMILCLLTYYHTIGKRVGESAFRGKFLSIYP